MYEIQELKLKLKLAHLEMDFEMKKMDFEMKKKDNRNKVLKSIVRKATHSCGTFVDCFIRTIAS